MSRHTLEWLEARQHFAATTLNRNDVTTVLGQAASQTQSKHFREEVIAVVDRDANVLGIFARPGVDLTTRRGQEIQLLAVARARTAALFASDQDAFTTRTARFIIQDHFPEPVDGTPGGPLYGVQFSNLQNTDVLSTTTPAITGDPGGIPLYKKGHAVGGVGAAGDGDDVAARADLDILRAYDPNPTGRVFHGEEESDADEAIALAGAQGYMAAESIQATRVFIDGLRTPFTVNDPASRFATKPLADLVSANVGTIVAPIVSTPASPYPTATFAGVRGILKRPVSADSGNGRPHNYGIEGSGEADTDHSLTSRDVSRIITDAIATAQETRAGIREPDGVPALVHVVVVDRGGNILGVFAEDDATNFSYDVAVQKARTANFFSDDDHAFSTRAIGFLSQAHFPIGIDGDQVGPLYHVQNEISTVNKNTPLTLRTANVADADNPLRNGITIFPGGVPLYKNGVIVGAVGVSGDGVDQDDRISYGGTARFRPREGIRSDELGKQEIRDFIGQRTIALFDLFGSRTRASKYRALTSALTVESVVARLEDLDFRLPYVKFPRNPDV